MENTPYDQHHHSSQDDIDLLDLIRKFWQYRLLIIIVAFSCLLLSVAYAFTTTPIYKAQTQLQVPSTADMAPINSGGFYTISPSNAFSKLLARLESGAHKNALIKEHSELIEKAVGITTDSNTVNLLGLPSTRKISYPETRTSDDSVVPEIYKMVLVGQGQDTLSQLLNADILLASEHVTNTIKKEYARLQAVRVSETKRNITLLSEALAKRRANKITRLTEKHTLTKQRLKDELEARIDLVLALRKDRVKELQQALSTAEALNIINPSTVTHLTARPSVPQVEANTEIRNQQEPLHLSGTKLLTAELESLEALKPDTLLDSKIRELETKLKRVKVNRNIEILKARTSDAGFSDEFQELQEELIQVSGRAFPEDFTIDFQNAPAITPSKPIKPQKAKIIIAGLFLGVLLGFFAALMGMLSKSLKAPEKA